MLETAQITYWNGTNRAEFELGKADEYTWIAPGLKSQMSEVLAALLWSQLELRDDIQARRMEICALYRDYLQPLMFRIPVSGVETGNGHLFCILVMKLSHRQPLRFYTSSVWELRLLTTCRCTQARLGEHQEDTSAL